MDFDDFDDINLTPEPPEEPEKKEEDKADIDEIAKSLGGSEIEQPEEPALPSDDEFTIPEIDESMSLNPDRLEEDETGPAESQIEKDDSVADPGDISLEGLDIEEPMIEEENRDTAEDAGEEVSVHGGEAQESGEDVSLVGMDSSEESSVLETETDGSSTEVESDSVLDLEETDLSAVSFDDEDFSLDSVEEEKKEEEQSDEIDESSFVIDGTNDLESAESLDMDTDQEQEIPSEIDVNISGPEDMIDSVIKDDDFDKDLEEKIPVSETEKQQETGTDTAESGVWEEEPAEEERAGTGGDVKKKKKLNIPVIVLIILAVGGGYYIYSSLFSKPAPPPRTPVRAAAPKTSAKPVVTNKYIYPNSDNVLKDKNEGVLTYIYSTEAGIGALYDFYKGRLSSMKYDTSQDDYSAGVKNAHIVYTKGNSVVAVVLRDRGSSRSVVLSYVE